MSNMTPQEAADVVERGTVPGADRALRVLIDHARAATPEGGDLAPHVRMLRAFVRVLRRQRDDELAARLADAADAMEAHRCAPSVAIPPRKDEWRDAVDELIAMVDDREWTKVTAEDVAGKLMALRAAAASGTVRNREQDRGGGI